VDEEVIRKIVRRPEVDGYQWPMHEIPLVPKLRLGMPLSPSSAGRARDRFSRIKSSIALSVGKGIPAAAAASGARDSPGYL